MRVEGVSVEGMRVVGEERHLRVGICEWKVREWKVLWQDSFAHNVHVAKVRWYRWYPPIHIEVGSGGPPQEPHRELL